METLHTFCLGMVAGIVLFIGLTTFILWRAK